MKSKVSAMRIACAAALACSAAPDLLACGQSSGSILEIPTFGGTSFSVEAVNTNGQFTGFSYLPGDMAAHAFFYNNGSMADLGTFGGGVSVGYGINNLGQIAGQADLTNGQTHAFFSDGSSLTDLGTLGGTSSGAIAINDAGQIAGNSVNLLGQNEAFLYSAGSMTGLGDLGGGSSQANAMNANGSVAGDSLTASFESHAFIYKNGAMTDLGTLGSGYSSAKAINKSDVVVGESADTLWQTHAFLYSNGSLQDLGTLGGTFSSARAINDAGQILGVATITNDTARHGFVYQNGIMTDLGTLGGQQTEPAALNNDGDAVGYSTTPSGDAHAFLWTAGQLKDLNDLLPTNSNWVLQDALLISDVGQIIGYGLHNGATEWYVLGLPSQNSAPIAKAGPNQTVECPAAVTLDGSQSSDPDGDAITFEWRLGGTVIGTAAKITVSLPLGQNIVKLIVTDACGASSTATVNVNVVDTTPPSGSCPGDVTVAADANCSAPVPNFAALVQASDNCTASNALQISQSPAAGTVVGLGQNPVDVVVVDGSGNRSTCQVIFTVTDQTAPVITQSPSAQSVQTDSNCQGAVPDLTSQVVASDNCSTHLLVTQQPVAGTLLPGGNYTITLTVSDAAGNSTSANVPLTIVGGGGAPVVSSISASPSVITPPNHQMVAVRVTVNVTGGCGAAPVSKIVSVTSNESISPSEVQITGPLTVNVAASRNSSGNGRYYFIKVQTIDGSGNCTSSTVSVFVPKGNGNGTGGSTVTGKIGVKKTIAKGPR